MPGGFNNDAIEIKPPAGVQGEPGEYIALTEISDPTSAEVIDVEDL